MEATDWKLRVRELPPVHLFYGLTALDEKEMLAVLPYLSPEQWNGVLDLSVWTRDRMSLARFLEWQRHLLATDHPLATRLAGAVDSDLWELLFKKSLDIYERISEDEYEHEPRPDEDWLRTPDGEYIIVVRARGEQATLLRSILLRLYELNPDATRLMLASCRARTSIEIEESAYQQKRRRIEELGFQDYFEAVEVYSSLPSSGSLPQKKWETSQGVSTLPARMPAAGRGSWLLFRAFSLVPDPAESGRLLEELFFVCNKVLSADRVSPADTVGVRRGLRRALSGINLGLDVWSGGDAARAAAGIRRHYLQSFFQIAYGELRALRARARSRVSAAPAVEPGSLEEAVIQGLNRRYPLFTLRVRGRFRRRHFLTRRDLDWTARSLSRLG